MALVIPRATNYKSDKMPNDGQPANGNLQRLSPNKTLLWCVKWEVSV